MILLVDNYDSFVHNLARYFRRLGHETLVMRNDVVPWEKLEELAVDAVVLSPGPGAPDQAGCCLELVTRWASKLPILGVCLGHQVIGQALGATVVRAPQPIHGRSSLVEHDGVGLFVGLPNPLRVGRYHSLAIDAATMPSCLRVTARTEEGVLMAFEHECWPLYGVQFHPESVLTEHGYEILASFLRHSGLTSSEAPADEVSRVCWGNRTPQSAQPPRASAPSNSPPREARGIGKDALSIELESEQWPEYPVRYRRSVEEP